MKFAMAAIVVASGLFTAAALSQPAPPSAHELALSNKLLFELSSGVECSANLISAANEIAGLKAKVADLEKQLAAKP